MPPFAAWLVACLVASLAWSAASPWPAFPLSDVRAGLRGSALTEGPGGIERFDVEVLGIHSGSGGLPLVLIRASGGPIDVAGGVAAGMSGSPVLLPWPDGGEAILGAIGYTFLDAPGGLALVTPIEAMRSGAVVAAPPAGAVAVTTPVLVAGLGERAVAFAAGALADATGTALTLQGGGGVGAWGGGTWGGKASSGIGDAAPMDGGLGDGSAGGSGPLAPGAAIGVAWLRGDVDLIVTGTLTEEAEGAWLAFGHPILAAGAIDWPVVGADVLAFVPRRSLPFKLAIGGDVVLGVARRDRLTAVSGTVGGAADTLPVTLTIAGDAAATLRFDAVRDANLWPALIAIAAFEGLERARGEGGGGTATLHWDVAFTDGPGVRLSESVVDPTDLATAAARLAAAPLALLAGNPFAEPRLARLDVLVEFDRDRSDVEIRQVLTDSVAIVAGGMLPLFVRMQPWRRSGRVEAIDVRLPDDWVGRVEIVVRGGGVDLPDEEPIDPDDAPLTFDELLAFLRERPTDGDLVVEGRLDGGPWERLERRRLDGFVIGSARTIIDVAPPP